MCAGVEKLRSSCGVGNIKADVGLNSRRWTKHGKLPFISYESEGAAGGSEMVSTMKIRVGDEEIKTIPAILKDEANYPNLRELAA